MTAEKPISGTNQSFVEKLPIIACGTFHSIRFHVTAGERRGLMGCRVRHAVLVRPRQLVEQRVAA